MSANCDLLSDSGRSQVSNRSRIDPLLWEQMRYRLNEWPIVAIAPRIPVSRQDPTKPPCASMAMWGGEAAPWLASGERETVFPLASFLLCSEG